METRNHQPHQAAPRPRNASSGRVLTRAHAGARGLGFLLVVLAAIGAFEMYSAVAAVALSPPTVVTEPPSSVTQSSTVLNATVNPNGIAVEDCHFEYGTSTSYGFNVACSTLPGSGTSPIAVSASLPGLSAATTYHLRIVASSAGGSSDGGDEAFRTPPKPPKVVEGAASSITRQAATLGATVNPNGGEVSACEFEYGTSETYGTSVACTVLPGSGESPVAVSAPLTGLSGNTQYHFRVVATNAGGTSYGSDATFTSLPDAPAVLTAAASAVTQTTATLGATVNPNGALVESCVFEYGLSTFYGNAEACASLPEMGTGAVGLSVAVGGLSANTTYHFRIRASGPGGASQGADQVLQTLPDAPAVATGAASSQTQTSATLNATVNPDSGPVSDCEFEYGSSIYYGASVPCASPPGDSNESVAVSASIGGLAPGSTYYFRVVATNAGGTSYGADQALTTVAPTPPVVPDQGVLGLHVSSPPPVPDAELSSRSLTADASGRFTLRVTCPADESWCVGTVTIRTLAAVAADSRGHQASAVRATILTLAKGSFKVAAGHAATIRLRLSVKARALLARSHVLRARASIVAHDAAGATHSVQSTVTIRLATAARSKG